MKKLLIAMTAVAAMAMASTPAFAHDWDGDAWATKQMTLFHEMDKCVTLSDTDFTLFMKTCSPSDIATDQVTSLNALTYEINSHPDDTSIGQFIAEHFKDELQANKAMASVDVVTKGLEFMKLRMELYRAKIQRNRDIQKATEEMKQNELNGA